MQVNNIKISASISRFPNGRFLFSVMGWIVIILLLTELLVRIFYGFSAQRNINSPDWGRVPATGAEIMMTHEGYGATHYIADGEIFTPYQGGENIVVIGDSHTEALQVMDIQKYPSIAEELIRKDGYLVDIHNLGFSGLSIPDYVFLAPLIIEKYKPSIVVVQLNSDDFSEAFETGRSNHFINRDSKPIVLVHTPRYYADPWVAWIRDLLNTSSAVVIGYSRFQQIVSSRKVSVGSTSITSSVPVVNKTYEELQALKAAYKDVSLVILYLPYYPVNVGDKVVFGDEAYQKVVQATKKINGWLVIDPSNEFNLLITKCMFPRGFNNSLPGKGHLNQIGHQIVGRLLADQIEKLLNTEK